jgi:hypothetical protein
MEIHFSVDQTEKCGSSRNACGLYVGESPLGHQQFSRGFRQSLETNATGIGS